MTNGGGQLVKGASCQSDGHGFESSTSAVWLAFFCAGTHRSSVIRFAAMASMKNTLVLGVFAVVCVLLFTLLNPNRYTVSYHNDNAFYHRVDGVTDSFDILDLRESSKNSTYRWHRIGEQRSQIKY